MSKQRRIMIGKMISIYGMESILVDQFIDLCHNLANNEWNDRVLGILVQAHDEYPQTEYIT